MTIRIVAVCVAFLTTNTVRPCNGFTPYDPAPGWTYNLQAARAAGCATEFISTNTLNPRVHLQANHDARAEFTLVASTSQNDSDGGGGGGGDGSGGIFYLKLANGKYLSYAGDCNNTVVDTWPEAGINQEFRIVPAVPTSRRGAEHVNSGDGGGDGDDGAGGGGNEDNNVVTFMRRLQAVGRAKCGAGTGECSTAFRMAENVIHPDRACLRAVGLSHPGYADDEIERCCLPPTHAMNF